MTTMNKTKWKIGNGQVTLYPNNIVNVFGFVFALIFLAFGYYAKNQLISSSRAMTSYLVIASIAVILFFLMARTYIVFDRSKQKMHVKLFGMFNSKTIDFINIAGIQPVYQNGGGFNFQVFQQDKKYGRGTRISCGYAKESNENAIALTNEVFPILEEYFAEVIPAVQSAPPERITTYKYYINEHGIYTLIVKSAVFYAIGAICLAFGIYSFIKPTSYGNYNPAFITFLFLLIGLFLLFTGTKKTVFDTLNKKIKISFIAGLKSDEYNFNDFLGFSVTRKTTNFVYSGTDVGLKLKSANPEKINIVVLQSLTKPKEIDLFIRETESILDADY